MIESNFSEILLRITGAFFYIVPTIFFIILAIYYTSKVGSTKEGTLILIGNILILIVTILHQFMYLFIGQWGIDLYSIISIGVNAISFIGFMLFLIGFYIMIQKIIKSKA